MADRKLRCENMWNKEMQKDGGRGVLVVDMNGGGGCNLPGRKEIIYFLLKILINLTCTRIEHCLCLLTFLSLYIFKSPVPPM